MRRLVIFISFVLIVIGLAACQEAKPVARATFTPTATAVPLPTSGEPTYAPINTQPASISDRFATAGPTPTTPSRTPTPEPTRPTIPTATPANTLLPDVYLTPSTPVAELSQYRLVPWTAEHADNLGRLMDSYTEVMRGYFYSSITEPIYRGQFHFPAAAYREAQLLFPDDRNVGRWRLGEIANEAGSGVNNEEQFREIVVDALNVGEVSLEGNELVDWFSVYPSFFHIAVNELQPLPGYESTHLLTINSGFEVGGMVALIFENENGYSSYPVFSNLGDFFAAGMSVYFGDLVNDVRPELVVSAGSHNGSMISSNLAVYDLGHLPPRQLSIGSQTPWTTRSAWSISVISQTNGFPFLQIRGGDRSFCPEGYYTDFAWNGQWFEQINFESDSQENDFSLCLNNLDMNYGRWWDLSEIEREIVLKLFESEFGDVPLPAVDRFSGEESPADYEDEVRYILAMNHAVLGNVAEAHEYLRLILDDPAVPESSWLEPAERFLSNYQEAADTYRACLAAGHCDKALALERTVRTLPVSDYGNIVGRLTDLGATVLNSGTFDFENDQSAETWVILPGLPEEPLELWLLAETDEGIAAEYIDEVTTLSPSFNHDAATSTQSFRNEPLYDYVPFTIGTGDVYSFVRRQRDGEPFVIKLLPVSTTASQAADPLNVEFEAAMETLFAGGDPAAVAERLTAVINNPAFTSRSSHYYYQGLAYQLAGDEENAVAAYVRTWQSCCMEWNYGPEGYVTADPFAVMAQAKLEIDN